MQFCCSYDESLQQVGVAPSVVFKCVSVNMNLVRACIAWSNMGAKPVIRRIVSVSPRW